MRIPATRTRSSRTQRSSGSVRYRAAAGGRRVALLVGAVARPHERLRKDRAEAEHFALLPEPAELVRVHPALDRRVLRRRLEVLADGDDVDAVLAQVAHRLDDLVVRLPQADDDPGLRQHRVVREFLRDRKSTRLNSSHVKISYAVFCLKK